MTTLPEIPDAVSAALAAHSTLTLAYADAKGPGACAVFYAWDPEAGAVYFLSSLTTRHGRALAQQPAGQPAGQGAGGAGARVAFTAQADGQDWRTLTGLQGAGRCRRLDGEERAAAFRVYTARFPFTAGEDALAAALARTDVWELRPERLRLIDNTRGFGGRQEWP